jgi:hypothetical protein
VAFKALHELDFWVSPWGDINGCKARQQADWNRQFQEFLIYKMYIRKDSGLTENSRLLLSCFLLLPRKQPVPLPSVALTLQQHHTGEHGY